MLCDLIKHENELYGYSAIAMHEIKRFDPETVEAYVKAFDLVKDEMALVNQPAVLELYSQAIRLVKHNRYSEFINYFTRNFGALMLEIGKRKASEEIKAGAEKMLEISRKYQKADLPDMKWGNG